MNFKRAIGLTILSLATVLEIPMAEASSRPSWFPRTSCREAWGGRDQAKYDFTNDVRRSPKGNIGYGTYQRRLALEGVDRRSCYKDWTILVFMAGDNDLSPYALWDIDEMEGRFESARMAGSTLKSDLLAELDTEGPTGIRRLHIFQREDRPYTAASSLADYAHRTPFEIQSPIVDLAPEGHLSKAERFQQFLDWGTREYPAEHYMVVVWGHGQGWAGGAKDVVSTPPEVGSILQSMGSIPQPPNGKFGGIMGNPATGDSLSIPQLRDALANVVTQTLEGMPFSVYASDACLMQMSEVAYELAPSARFIAGSAQVQSFLGLPYRRMMYELNSGRFLSLAGSIGKADEPMLMAKMLPVLTERALDPVHGQQGRSEPSARETFTMSSLSSSALRFELVPATKRLSQALRAYLDEDFFRALGLGSVLKSAPSFLGGGKEFGSLLTLIEIARTSDVEKTGAETIGSKYLKVALEQTRVALDRTVIERRFGTNYQTGTTPFHLLGYRGLGVWIPNSTHEFKERASDFALSSFETETEWQSWLKPALGIAP